MVHDGLVGYGLPPTDYVRRSDFPRLGGSQKVLIALLATVGIGVGIFLGVSATGPPAAEISACSAATTVITPPTFPSGETGLHFYSIEQIRGVENSDNASIANAAKEWLAALAHSNQAEVHQAATKMLQACHHLGA
jgi:hypothetical protein